MIPYRIIYRITYSGGCFYDYHGTLRGAKINATRNHHRSKHISIDGYNPEGEWQYCAAERTYVELEGKFLPWKCYEQEEFPGNPHKWNQFISDLTGVQA